MASPTILGLGLISLDIAIEVADLPVDGRIHAERALPQGGGMAANTLVALAALGWPVEMVGAVGTDEAGKQAIRSLRAARVGTRWVQHRTRAVTPQAICIAQIEHGRRTIIGLPERGCELRVRDLPSGLSIQNSKLKTQKLALLHTDGWHGVASVAAMQTARGRGWMTSYNGGWVTTHSRRLARLADVVVVSRDFARELTTEKKPAEMLRAVGRWIGEAKEGGRLENRPYPKTSQNIVAHVYPKRQTWHPDELHIRSGERWLVLTAGAEGAWGLIRKMAYPARPTAIVHRPAYPVKVADSTGAGDAFHAGLLHGRLQGWSLEESLRWAAAAGALACAKLGARASDLSVTKIRRVLSMNS